MEVVASNKAMALVFNQWNSRTRDYSWKIIKKNR